MKKFIPLFAFALVAAFVSTASAQYVPAGTAVPQQPVVVTQPQPVIVAPQKQQLIYDAAGNPVSVAPTGQQPMYIPVLDANGNQVYDANGQPVYQLIDPNTPYGQQMYYRYMQQQKTADGLFGIARGKMTNIFANVRLIVFILGGFGLILFAVMAIFGKPNWKGFAILAIGLFVVAVAGAVIEFTTGADAGLSNTIQVNPQNPAYPPQMYQQPYIQTPTGQPVPAPVTAPSATGPSLGQ